MPITHNHEKYLSLRTEYKRFIFEAITPAFSEKELLIKYHFRLDDRMDFFPELRIPRRAFYTLWSSELLHDALFQNLIFHVGLVELISYWKAACPQEVIIRPFSLTPEQAQWWKGLYYRGLSEFFYLNGIKPDEASFMAIHSEGPATGPVPFPASQAFLIPVGGGKDSVVTLEMLKSKGHVHPFLLNPRIAMTATLSAAGFTEEDAVVFRRTLDPALLELNEQGFLNGHTPFSALLAFQTLLAAYLSGSRYIALSNESSANEATIPGTHINHQYSKSYHFERTFRDYYKRFLTPSADYFSFLRPLNELQIAALFADHPAHHSVFRSCNAGSKENKWCGSCPKCLFAWIILYPFLGREKLQRIFRKNLFDDPALYPILLQLTGKDQAKPFECVGTIDEVNEALMMSLGMQRDAKLPLLLRRYREDLTSQAVSTAYVSDLLCAFNEENFVPEGLLPMIKDHLPCTTD